MIIFGGDADTTAARRRPRLDQRFRPTDTEAAAADVEIKRLIDLRPVLQQRITPGNAKIGSSLLDIGADISSADDQKANRLAVKITIDHQFARRLHILSRLQTGRRQ